MQGVIKSRVGPRLAAGVEGIEGLRRRRARQVSYALKLNNREPLDALPEGGLAGVGLLASQWHATQHARGHAQDGMLGAARPPLPPPLRPPCAPPAPPLQWQRVNDGGGEPAAKLFRHACQCCLACRAACAAKFR